MKKNVCGTASKTLLIYVKSVKMYVKNVYECINVTTATKYVTFLYFSADGNGGSYL